MACKHAIVTNQKSAMPPESRIPAEDMQICCICGQLRSQQWGPWHEPIDVKERTMAEDCKTEKASTSSGTIDAVGEGPLPQKGSDWYPEDHGKTEKQRRTREI